MINTQIEKAMQNDVSRLQEISRKTFKEAFSSVNTEENMAKYMEETLSVAKLSLELENDNSAFYFASVDNKTIGYLKLNFGTSQTDIKDPLATEIERIYVLKAYQGKNVGQLLFEKALEIARQKKHHYIWLGVWEENQAAIRFYERNGFVAFDKHLFILGNDEQTDILMKLKLTYLPD
jgi:ribosomal protein S18 acetylase RimI-like enzyme